MDTTNKLTILRMALILVFLILLYLRFLFHVYFAPTVFILANAIDSMDGYIARHYNQVTDFGEFMDPPADKVLVMAALFWFVEAGRSPAWVLLVVTAQEFATTALRLIAVERGRVIAAAQSGKVKTTSTMVCIRLMLFVAQPALDLVCMVVTLVTAVCSSAEYFVRNKDVVS